MKKYHVTGLILIFILTVGLSSCKGSQGGSSPTNPPANNGGDLPAIPAGVNIKDYGAVGDGETDDTAAIEKAFNEAVTKNGIVIIPEGVFCTRMLPLKPGLHLIGSSNHSIIKTHTSTALWESSTVIENLLPANITLENIIFDGNKPIVEGNTEEGRPNLRIESSSDITIKKCTFQNNWYGNIIIYNSNGITVDDNRFLNSDCGVITLGKPSKNITVRNNYFDGADWSEPISIYASEPGWHENIVITGNTIKNHPNGQGIMIRAAKNVTITGNTIDNCNAGIMTIGEPSLGLGGVYQAVIRNNHITNCQYEGILITDLYDSEISNNIIEKSKNALAIKKADRCQIINNQIIESKGFFSGLTNSTVSGNQFYNPSMNDEVFCYISFTYSGYTSGICDKNVFTGNSGTPTSTNILFGLSSPEDLIRNTFSDNTGKIE